MAIDFEKDDILIIARYLSEQGFYYSPQWEQAADEIERLRSIIELQAEEMARLNKDVEFLEGQVERLQDMLGGKS